MKKIIILLSLSITLILFLSACSSDFSSQVNEGMEDINNSIDGAFEPLFKEDEKHKPGYESDTSKDSDTSSETETESDTSSETESDTGSQTESDTSSETESDTSSESDKKEYTIGTGEGNKLPSYSVEIFDENGLTGEKIDPSSLGKVTVINFWGTWCPPCVAELPEFDEVASEYGDQITMIAIHSVDGFAENAVSHISENFKDSQIIFAKDINLGQGNASFDECYETFGGYGYYPHTIVLTKDGVIVYSESGGLYGEDLAILIDVALAN